MSNVLRPIRHALTGRDQSRTPFHDLTRAASRTDLIVAMFYAASLPLVIELMKTVQVLTSDVTDWHHLWPVAWLGGNDPTLIFRGVAFAAVAACLAAFQFRARRIARATFFVLFLLASAIPNSTGSINHPYHAWLWVAFLLIFCRTARRTGGRPGWRWCRPCSPHKRCSCCFTPWPGRKRW
ncbi:MAG: hypothetical protein AAGE76_10585 [Pseudomonadota bacterium]